MSVNESPVGVWKSPARKLVSFFERSRDQWKGKVKQLRLEAKLLNNQVRAVEKSREKWAQRARLAELRTRELERELEILKKVAR